MPDRPAIRPRDHAYAVLREAIVTARYEPGRRLSENELAAELGVSRTPVREALALLRDERLVVVAPQLGTYVTRISPAAVADAAFVREALECAAVRRAAERVKPGDADELAARLDRQQEAVDAHDATGFGELDSQLHRRLCELAGHPIAWELAHRADGQLDRVRRLSLPEPGYLAEMLAEHREVVAAVVGEDPDRAEAALRHHLRMVLSLLPQLRAARPGAFDPHDPGAR